MDKKHYIFIDRIKGLAILEIIWFHTYKKPEFVADYLWPVFLFVFIAGMFSKPDPARIFVKKLFRQLVVPLLLFDVICIAFSLAFHLKDGGSVADFDASPLWFFVNDNYTDNLPMWFLASLIAIKAVWRLIYALVRSKWWCLAVGVCITCAYHLAGISVDLIWLTEAVDMLPVFCVGNIIGRHLIEYCKDGRYVAHAALCAIAVLAVLVWAELVLRAVGSPYYVAAKTVATVAIYFVLLVVAMRTMWVRSLGFLEYYGRNSLAVLCLHYPVLLILMSLIEKYRPLNQANCLMAAVATALLLVPMIWAVNRVLPRITGRRQ